MSIPTWHRAYASVIGTSHAKTSLPCQDACACRVVQSTNGSEMLLAVVSDGAGSAQRSDFSSTLTVELFLGHFGRLAKEDETLHNISKELVLEWLADLRNKILEQASLESLQTQDFFCTLVGAVIGPNSAVFVQIGDGAIIVSEIDSDEYGYIFWPQHGEFANQTNFLFQDNISKTLEFEFVHKDFKKIALFSDGIERLVLDFSSKIVHPPALNSIFEWLERENCNDDHPSAALTAYLSSDFINQRTDDDKSLIMATRVCR